MRVAARIFNDNFIFPSSSHIEGSERPSRGESLQIVHVTCRKFLALRESHNLHKYNKTTCQIGSAIVQGAPGIVGTKLTGACDLNVRFAQPGEYLVHFDGRKSAVIDVSIEENR